MSYYFAIIGTKDNPIFDYEFGTSKQGGDGVARFREEARHMNQFIVHSSLDVVEEVQWTTGSMYEREQLSLHEDCTNTISTRYLKSIDRFYNNFISCFLTGSGARFLLLHCPDPTATHNAHLTPMPPSSNADKRTSNSSSIAYNPTSPATEEAVRNFFADVYENWVKTVMSPFYHLNAPVTSPVFRARVAAAGRKYL